MYSNHSLAKDVEKIEQILVFFKPLLKEGTPIINLALEWLRCQKVRLEYKKFLGRTKFPNDDLNLCIDACIFLFFLKYDSELRDLFNPDIKPYEYSTLLGILFSAYETSERDIDSILEQHKAKFPISFDFNIDLEILGAGLSEIIKNDFDLELQARDKKDQTEEETEPKTDIILEFDGTPIERTVKTFCFNKRVPDTIIMDKNISQFLATFFKFGRLYKSENFKDKLITKLCEYMFFGLTDPLQNNSNSDTIETFIHGALINNEILNNPAPLDGLVWKKDLTPIISATLKSFLAHSFDNLCIEAPVEIDEQIPIEDEKKQKNKDKKNKKGDKEVVVEEEDVYGIDFESIFDLDLSIDDYRDKLEVLLEKAELSLIDKRNISRAKVEEFKKKKRESKHEI